MGKLAEALKRKYKTPKDALRALGLDESLLDVKRLAQDAKKRARDESSLAELATQSGGHKDWDMGPESDGIPDLGDEEPEPEKRFFGGRDDEEERARRKWRMSQLADHLLAPKEEGGQGWDKETVRNVLADFPKTGLEHLGGALDEDLEGLIGMGGEALPLYEDKDMMQTKDKKRMAKDARLMATQLGLDRLSPRRGEMTNWGDQELPLAMDDAASDFAAEVDRWFGTGRIGLG